MRPYIIPGVSSLQGEITLPGDKSISHRAVIIGSLARGETRIENFLVSEDTLRTIEAFKSMGIEIKSKIKNQKSKMIVVYGKGLNGLKKPKLPLYMGGSGTTCRLLLGVLSGQNFETEIFGNKSLSKRPMSRLTQPLREMGAIINSKFEIRNSKFKEEYLPIVIKGRFPLKPITYRLPIPSAQVKSAILLAGLFAKGETEVFEPIKSRDHTERMLKIFGADIKKKGYKIRIGGLKELVSPRRIFIPSDISSAAFFIVGAAILEGSNLVIRSVGINPTRIGFIKVLQRMGADIKIKNRISKIKNYEPMADIIVKGANLEATTIEEEEIPSLIDELPILMVAACFARGRSIIKGVSELRVKETDRINSMVSNLQRMGADIKIKNQISKIKIESIVINGVKGLKGTRLSSFGDHRTAMSLVIAGIKAKNKSQLDDIDCIKKSFPNFLEILREISK